MPHTNVHADVRLSYRLVLAVDVEKYSTRDARDQLQAQTDLRQVLSAAAHDVGLDRSLWYEQVSGDGELVVLPEDVDVSLVVGDFTRQLEVTLGAFNRQRTAGTRLRLRVALHHGTLTPGPFGPAGDAPIVVSRLLNARPARRVLADEPDRDVALIISASLYQDVVRTGFCALDPETFRPVRVNAKGVLYHGFVQRTEAVPAVAEQRIAAPVILEPAVIGGPVGLVALPGGRA